MGRLARRHSSESGNHKSPTKGGTAASCPAAGALGGCALTLAKRKMKTIGVMIVLILPLLCGASEVSERPIWLPLGTAFRLCQPGTIVNGDTEKTNPVYDTITAEVYQENDRLTVQTNVLQLIQEPRWFKGSKPPGALQDVPLTNQGASLALAIAPSNNQHSLHLVLTLKAQDRSVWRELEHRWTNILPFLFAFAEDGKPIGPRNPPSWSKFGGVNWMTELVPGGTSASWDVLIDTKSITAALSGRHPTTVTVVAAFSECQHEVPALFGRDDGDGGIKGEFKGPPITIRSNELRLDFDGERLRSREDR